MKLSLIVPVFNEESNIYLFYKECLSVFDPLDIQVEFIFINDGSSDRSYEIICDLSKKDFRVKGISLSKNFGSHAAILAGLHEMEGDVAVPISVDLQDPPNLIPKMIEKWYNGFHVVWATRGKREDPWSKKVFANIFYYIFRKTAIPNYPRQGMDFGLLDKKVITVLCSINETNPFITGLILWLGFKQTNIPYNRNKRLSGISKWPFWKRIKSAIDAMVSFSYFPIRFISFMGLIIAVGSLIYAAFTVIVTYYTGKSAPGYPSLMVAILFLGGVQLITMGILGEYIWRCTDQVKGRPRYIIMEKVGFEEKRKHDENSPNNSLDRR